MKTTPKITLKFKLTLIMRERERFIYIRKGGELRIIEKLSYRCISNMAMSIARHNNKVMRSESSKNIPCNCEAGARRSEL